MNLREAVAPLVKGDVIDDADTLKKFSRDTSIFERKPALVVYPKNKEDISALVRFALERRAKGEDVTLTARSAGTDMSGGPLTDSIVVGFTKYMNGIPEIGDDYAIAEPGAYYRDFEKATLAANGKILPPYPASRELAAIGGMIANNCGGELTLRFGKINRYVRELDVVLSDGSAASFRPLSKEELAKKEAEQTFEGEIYRKMRALIENNADEIADAEPSVSKNSAGYFLWNVWNEARSTFDLTQLITGSQGTLALVTRAKLGLEKLESHRGMLVVFLSDLELLPEFAEESNELAREKAEDAQAALEDLALKTRLAFGTMEEKYWKIRRESFALLRKHIHGLHAAPLIDNIVVHPDDYPRFLPQLNELLSHYKILYTVAGHIGDGNFHIIPLVDLKRPEHHKTILELTPRVYELVARYKGSITGEHNDGLIRTPYLHYMFSPRMIELFAEVKRIFDPHGVFNPGKKVPVSGDGGSVKELAGFMMNE